MKYHTAVNTPLPVFGARDWLFYDRCELFSHDDHGPVALSALRALPFRPHDTVLILSANDRPICRFYQRVRRQYLLRLVPALRFVRMERSTLARDFARLCMAPRVVIPWIGSSWALWATIGNTAGVTYAPDFWAKPQLNNSRILMPRVHIGTPEIGLPDIKGNLSAITRRHHAAFSAWLTRE